MSDAVEFFKALSDPTRLRILHLLGHGPLCVCHIHDVLELPQAKVSRQLGYLRERGLVEPTRHFNWTVYRLPEALPLLVTESLQTLEREVFSAGADYAKDLSRLRSTDTSVASEACGDAPAEPAEVVESETLDTSLL